MIAPPAHGRASRGLLAAAVVCAAVSVAAGALLIGGGDGDEAEGTPAEAAAQRFLERYVEADGRVVRHDQGGDTVSEGQAYAMLLAVAAGDEDRFVAAAVWAQVHLGRADGLLSSRWGGGRVRDRQPAADADLDAAHALVLGARRFGRPAYRAAALRIGRSVLARETVRAGGRLVLVAGPWARDGRIVNPSYFAPAAFGALGRASADRRWAALAASSRTLAGRLLERLPPLPPDWARLEAGGRLRPTGAPGQPASAPRYGFDAVRLPIRLAVSCDPGARRLAARMWPFLGGAASDGGLSAAYTLDGRPALPYSHPAALVGAAGAAAAAGDRAASDRLLDRAAALDERHPTYYGAAWVALGRVLLQTRLLGGCGAS